MRVYSDGGELRDTTMLTSTITSNATVGCDATGAIGTGSGGGYWVIKAGGSALCRGAMMKHMDSIPRTFTTADGAAKTTFMDFDIGRALYVRFLIHLPTVASAATSGTANLFRIGDGTPSGISTAFAARFAFNCATGGFLWNSTAIYTPSLDTTYRVEIKFLVGSGGVGAWSISHECKIFTQTGTVPLATLAATTSASINTFDCIEFGIATSVTINDEFQAYFDEWAFNRNYGGGGSQHHWCNGGSFIREQNLTAGTHQEWTASAGTHPDCVETDTVFRTYDDADYVRSTNTLPMRETFALPAYPGGNTIKTLSVIVRILGVDSADTPGAGNNASHESGVLDGSGNFVDAQLPVETGAPGGSVQNSLCIIEAQNDGLTALTNSWYGGVEASVRRTADVSGTNFNRVTYILLEVEDDDGVILPIANDLVQVKQAINRAGTY